ncbi:MAG: hypothetical protein Ct9H300mP28_17710 [Pseudomonadota bacterium]|nr:MAG: hypothetical protein Ct9H300mP28_17710 [Pseudomonadota bacterium]
MRSNDDRFIGDAPSASIGGEIGMYEPVHGSAPDITGQDKGPNPGNDSFCRYDDALLL